MLDKRAQLLQENGGFLVELGCLVRSSCGLSTEDMRGLVVQMLQITVLHPKRQRGMKLYF